MRSTDDSFTFGGRMRRLRSLERRAMVHAVLAFASVIAIYVLLRLA